MFLSQAIDDVPMSHVNTDDQNNTYIHSESAGSIANLTCFPSIQHSKARFQTAILRQKEESSALTKGLRPLRWR